ncbi:hypothetical protein QWZ14_11480 [Paeniroseomonas aquatica]|uniref:Transposase n=1 Tax=Paeniroseomonas aquatica TaxID=373043 RepID=A0ABT8A5L1_9PROT|nr:hypothetical protein [Paeniroseomonas aquatica]MDN3564981.1 hypothetical protein [Paeniroseomonas aquatica]
MFQNDEVVIHAVRRSRDAGIVAEVMANHRPAIWVSDLYGAQRGHAEAWQICLAHQLRDCRYAAKAGDAIFAPRIKALLLRAVVLPGDIAVWPKAHGVSTAAASSMRSIPSWRSPRRIGTASDCETATGNYVSSSSPSRSSRRYHRQQWERAKASTDRHRSQGHRWFSIHLGR